MHTIERAFNSIWRFDRGRSRQQRAAIYLATLTVGPVLIGMSLSMTSYAVSISLGLVQGIPWAGEFILRVTPLVFTISAFTLLYYLLPSQHVRFRHALVGGVAAGALFELMKRGFALYVSLFPSYTVVYGAFASVPVFLLWVYCSWVVAVLGAVITSLMPVYPGALAHRGPIDPGLTETDQTARVLRALNADISNGRVRSTKRVTRT
jgi:membrane protein